jgi:peptidoglycan/xylan/chitin deacetylase (PgdA/CDA1 family)
MKYLKDNIKMLCTVPYAFYLWAAYKHPRKVIIYYHSIKKDQAAKFEKQMAYLSKKCLVVKPSEIINQKGEHSNKKIAAITFDDAFVSIADNCFPILKKYCFTAGIFVPTKYLGRLPNWASGRHCTDTDELVMNEQQIAELDRQGYEIFSHTVSHPVLTDISDDALEIELVDSKKTLEKILGHQVCAISYPHGAYDDRVCNAARKAGYDLGFTIEPDLIDNFTEMLKIGRVSVSPDDSLAKFKLKVSGAYRAVGYLMAVKRLIMRKCNNKDDVCR